jgi:hypothetical protein
MDDAIPLISVDIDDLHKNWARAAAAAGPMTTQSERRLVAEWSVNNQNNGLESVVIASLGVGQGSPWYELAKQHRLLTHAIPPAINLPTAARR